MTDHITVTDRRHIEWCVSGPDGMATFQFCREDSCLIWQDPDGSERLLPQELADTLTGAWVRDIWTHGDIADHSLIWAWLEWIYSWRGAV